MRPCGTSPCHGQQLQNRGLWFRASLGLRGTTSRLGCTLPNAVVENGTAHRWLAKGPISLPWICSLPQRENNPRNHYREVPGIPTVNHLKAGIENNAHTTLPLIATTRGMHLSEWLYFRQKNNCLHGWKQLERFLGKVDIGLH